MSIATLSQAQELLMLFSRDRTKRAQLQKLLESGLLAELARADPEHVDREAFRAALVANKPVECYTISVDYYLSLEQMLKEAKLDKVHPDVVELKFPQIKHQVLKMEIQLHHFGCKLCTPDVLAELWDRKLQPATLPEILALAAAQPQLQNRFWIAGLGSSSEEKGRLRFPLLYGVEGERGLNLVSRDPDATWEGECRFAAVSEEPLAA